MCHCSGRSSVVKYDGEVVAITVLLLCKSTSWLWMLVIQLISLLSLWVKLIFVALEWWVQQRSRYTMNTSYHYFQRTLGQKIDGLTQEWSMSRSLVRFTASF